MPRACYLLGVADVFHLDDGEGVGAEVRDVRAGRHHVRATRAGAVELGAGTLNLTEVGHTERVTGGKERSACIQQPTECILFCLRNPNFIGGFYLDDAARILAAKTFVGRQPRGGIASAFLLVERTIDGEEVAGIISKVAALFW